MGYTHYWRKPAEVDPETFTQIADDFNKVVLALDDMGVKIAGPDGTGIPEITQDTICFNGLTDCGHAPNAEISIPWPAKMASGLGSNQSAVSGDWFAGALLATRACNGSCDYETFAFDRVVTGRDTDDAHGRIFDCCKTAFRPYDIAATALLIIAKKHMGWKIKVSSDGEDEHWNDAKTLTYINLGYGPEFYISDGELLNKLDKTIEPAGTHVIDRVAAARDAAKAKALELKSESRYSHLKQSGEVSGSKLVASNIRVELKRSFPGVKFSVTMDGYDSVNVKWEDGPTAAAVDAIALRHKSGSFDGMTDSYNYESNPFGDVFGRCRYVFTSRRYSFDYLREAVREVALTQGYDLVKVTPSEYGAYLDRNIEHWHNIAIHDYLEHRGPYQQAA